MEKLASVDSLVISQQKEWGEILTDFETRNKYAVSDASGNRLYLAAEEAGSTLLRLFLKAYRPFTLAVLTEDGRTIMRVRRPFRFYFHRAEILDDIGQRIGAIERRFGILRRIYSVFDNTGSEIYQLYGPLLHPWTFLIMSNGVEHGKIIKEWSGLGKEAFTDADVFGAVFPANWDTRLKALFLGIVFLIDFVHFENTN